MDSIIKLRNITKFYGETVKTQVLFGINLDVEKGEFASIIGKSGSGKSTLLNIIGTLDYPSEGEVFINGKSPKIMDKNQLSKLRNETLGFIFQFHHLIPEFSVIENVLMPSFIDMNRFNLSKKEKAIQLLEIVGMGDYIKRKATDLSGGQKQRVAIARALINDPPLVLADEPTGNLDCESTDKIYDLLRVINQKFNTTILVITHDIEIARKSDRIIKVKDGRIIEDSKNEIRTN